MATPLEKLRIFFPEFESESDYPDTLVTLFITAAGAELDAEVWGSFYERGALVLAAHLLAMRKRSLSGASNSLGASVANVNSIKTGDEQIAFSATGAATASTAEAALRTTPYGLEYMRLSERVIGTPFMV